MNLQGISEGTDTPVEGEREGQGERETDINNHLYSKTAAYMSKQHDTPKALLTRV